MAAPIAPTALSICTEGFRKAGVRSPSTPEIEQARTEWLEEIKAEIWERSKTLTSMQSEAVTILANGQGRYPNPTDFSSLLSLTVLTGARTGTAQAGGSGSITLAATEEDADGAYFLGKKLVVTSGAGKSSLSQCIAWDNITKIASVTPNWAIAPTTGSGYLVVEREQPLTLAPAWRYDQHTQPTVRGTPTHYAPVGDADDGEILLVPVPHATMAIRMRYYADLTRLDLAGTRLATVYRRWRNMFVRGIAARAVAPDDERWKGLQGAYQAALSAVVLRESYGTDLSGLSAQVADYA